MNLTVKVLQGSECIVSVTPETSVFELKQQIESKLKIPVAYQKIIYLGRTLIDDSSKLSMYKRIKDGTKITVVVKKPDSLKEVIDRSFHKFYRNKSTDKLTEQFMIEFDRNVKNFSLDDIERIATDAIMQQEQLK